LARIAGIDIPREKRIEVGLRSIYGIGQTLARQLLTQAGVSFDTRTRDLTEEEVNRLNSLIQNAEFKVEGDLRREVQLAIKRLMDIGCYRGSRHIKHLPARGQRTRTNARTRKGPRKTVAGKKQAPSKG
jgi:small subunit ribosomal protein S13